MHIFGAKSGKGRTIAVLGSGLHKIYPEQNTTLYKEIINEGGCVISEYAPDENANSEYFPARNRIISGLSIGVLIIEARYRSGSGITARLATEQKKEIFCIPRDIDKKTGYLTNEYIKNGAHLVTTVEDIIEYCPIQYDAKEVNEEYKEVYKYIGEIPISVDEICKYTNLSIASINEKLMLMEIESLIRNVPGGYVRV